MKDIKLLGIVFGLTIFAKVFEWLCQGFTISIGWRGIQISFILAIGFILFKIFKILKLDDERFLFIPPLAYFLKEVYNLIFFYKLQFGIVVFIALIIEPLALLVFILFLNELYMKKKGFWK